MELGDVQEFSARAAEVGRALNPAVVLIAGVEYAATVPAPRREAELVAGGEQEEGELVARIALMELATAPAEQQPLKWKRPGEAAWRAPEWWIETVRRAEIEVEWVLRCRPKN